MTQYRRLGLLKVKKESKKTKKPERIAELRLMGLKKKIESFDANTGQVKVSDATTSHQMKLNSLAVNRLNVQKGDRIDIVQTPDNHFLIAKVTGENEGRTLSANKGTEALSLTFGAAHNLMKEFAHAFEVTNQVLTAQTEEEKQLLSDYQWYMLTPITENVNTERKVENKEKEFVASSVDNF